MTTTPDWMRATGEPVVRTRWERLRRMSPGALTTWALVLGTLACVVWSATSFGLRVHDRSVERAALEQAAVDALPPGLTVVLRGVYAVGDAEGYATAFSPLPADDALTGLQPAGDRDWAPIAGADTPTSRAWLSAAGDHLLTLTALDCTDDKAPEGCPAGGSSLTATVAPGGPNS